jgi:hypothetical protein
MLPSIDSYRIGILLACLMGPAVLCAQQPTPIPQEDGVYTLHENTHLALLDVTVTDKQGHPVAGLTRDDFNLTEDGQPQTIKFFEEHSPIDPTEIEKEKAAALAAQTKFFEEHEAAAKAGQPLNTFTNYEPFTGRPVTVLLVNELFPVIMNHFDQDPLVQRMAQDPAYLQAVQDATHQWKVKDPELNRVVHDPQISRKILQALGLQTLWKYNRQRMLDIVQSAPPDTPFAVYALDSQLRLVQSITTDRALLQARIDLLWKVAPPPLWVGTDDQSRGASPGSGGTGAAQNLCGCGAAVGLEPGRSAGEKEPRCLHRTIPVLGCARC